MRASWAAVVLAMAGLAALPASAASPVSALPATGTPETAFHVEVPALFRVRQLEDRYWFILHGPGGRQCVGAVTDRVGVTPPPSAKTVSVDLPGVRVVGQGRVVTGPWCPGTFNGHVEFRDWQPRTHRYVTHRIGTFSVRVQRAV